MEVDASMGSIGEPDTKEVECLVIGGGFGAVALLRKLLQNGFDARVYEKGSSFGGIWREYRPPYHPIADFSIPIWLRIC